MTVKEYIEELRKLDQDKGIWVEYDTYVIFPPMPDRVATCNDLTKSKVENGLRIGDYIITAG